MLGFKKNCLNFNSFIEACSKRVMEDSGIEFKEVNDCFKDSFGNADDITEAENSILASEWNSFKGEGI
jgi:hypothetical protein